VSATGRLYLSSDWKVRWSSATSFLCLVLALSLQVAKGPLPFGGPDPLNQRWNVALMLAALVLMVPLAAFSLDHIPGGFEFEAETASLHLRELQTSLYRRAPRVLAEVACSSSDLRYLESQHGVILKSPSFHRDLILPRGQVRDLIAWLQAQGVRRFSLEEASR